MGLLTASHHSPRRLPSYRAVVNFMTLSLALAAGSLRAQTFHDPALEALYVADKTDELRRMATERLARQPEDAQAVLAMALVALERDDNSARRQALERAQACAERQPQSAPCHYAHGVVLGVQAMSEGLMKAARSAGTVRDALRSAHELEPNWYPARSALMEFYLIAPGFMGGSESKAAALARSAPHPAQAAALQARVAMQAKQVDAAMAGFFALPARLEPAVAADVLGWAAQAGLGLVNEGQAAKAQPLFEKLLHDHPGHAAGAYGLARVRGEAGDWPEALRLYEQAATLKGAREWPMLYRIGMAQQQLGRNEAAKASYTRFLATAKGPKAALDDARKRLEQLRS